MSSAQTTRVGLIADVHADDRALRDALAHFRRLDCAAVLCAGDLLDWGRAPEKTIALLRQHAIPCIRGNHDHPSVDGRDLEGRLLSDRTLAFLDTLPRTISRTVAGVRIAVWHARPGSEMDGLYPDTLDLAAVVEAASADVLVVGHTHVPMAVTFASGIVVNPGSLLRDHGSALPVATSATFGLLELPSLRLTVHDVTTGAEVEVAAARYR